MLHPCVSNKLLLRIRFNHKSVETFDLRLKMWRMGSILVRTGRCTGRQQLCNRVTVNFLWENSGTMVWHQDTKILIARVSVASDETGYMEMRSLSPF